MMKVKLPILLLLVSFLLADKNIYSNIPRQLFYNSKYENRIVGTSMRDSNSIMFGGIQATAVNDIKLTSSIDSKAFVNYGYNPFSSDDYSDDYITSDFLFSWGLEKKISSSTKLGFYTGYAHHVDNYKDTKDGYNAQNALIETLYYDYKAKYVKYRSVFMYSHTYSNVSRSEGGHTYDSNFRSDTYSFTNKLSLILHINNRNKISPFVGIDYYHIRHGGISETGNGGDALNFDSVYSDSLLPNAGVSFSSFNYWNLFLFSIKYNYQLGDAYRTNETAYDSTGNKVYLNNSDDYDDSKGSFTFNATFNIFFSRKLSMFVGGLYQTRNYLAIGYAGITYMY